MNKKNKTGFSDKQIKALDSFIKTESKSDATPTIRGFVFQDLLAIKKLFENDINGFVLCECVEDICFYGNKDDCLRIYQAKYKNSKISSDSLCEISANLFYDYHKFKNCFSTLDFFLCTKIDDAHDLSSHTEIQNWINKVESSDKIKKTPKFKRASKVFKSVDKSEYDNFTSFYNSDCIGSIDELIEDTTTLLLDYCKNNLPEIDCSLYDDNALKKVLLSLAHQRMLDSIKDNPLGTVNMINRRKVSRIDIIDCWKKAFTYDESLPLNTLLAIIDEIYLNTLINNEELSEEEYLDIFGALFDIYQKTKTWITDIFANKEGQLAFIRTASRMSAKKCKEWDVLSTKEKSDTLLMQYDGMQYFFGYLWKMIIDIYFEKGCNNDYLELNSYLDSSNGYIKFSYGSMEGVILPAVTDGTIGVETYNYLERIREFAPRIWYMNYHPDERRLSSYKWSMIDINKAPGSYNSSEIDADSTFFIECMKCININRGGWKEKDSCENCIFSNICKSERKEKWART